MRNSRSTLEENVCLSALAVKWDGKLEGYWVSYNEDGTKNASGFYKEGAKVGKWFFWKDVNLSEVDYSNNAIAMVKTWKQEAIAIKN